MRFSRLLATFSAAALLTTACVVPDPVGDSQETGGSGIPIDGPGRYDLVVESAGVDRTALVVVPETIDRPAPLVIALHGLGGTSQGIEDRSRLTPIAEREAFVVAYPQATGFVASWRVVPMFGPADVVFLRDLIESIAASVDIDPDRVYVTGNSNGGGMAARFVCEEPGLVAAVAPVAAAHAPDGCVPADPIPAVAFHGTADIVVPFEGREPITGSVVQWAERRVAANGCSVGYVTERLTEDAYVAEWSDGCPGAPVLLHVLEGGVHAWPVADDPSSGGIEASEIIWQFFADHPRG